MCEGRGVRSGLFFTELDCREVTVACNVRNGVIKLELSTFFDLNSVDIQLIEDKCRDYMTVMSLRVYGNGIVASVRDFCLIDHDIEKNKTHVIELFRKCCDVMSSIVPQLGE